MRPLHYLLIICTLGSPLAGADLDGRIAAMSVEEKVAQMHIMGFPGTALEDESLAMVVERGIGGFLFLPEKNALLLEDMAALSRAIQEAALGSDNGVPLFLGAAAGTGARALLHPLLGAVPTPELLALGASGQIEDTESAFRALGQDLRAVGLNFALAPSFNVLQGPWNNVVSLDTFGGDGEQVRRLAHTAIEALQREGVLGAAGHFPGWVPDSTDFANEALRLSALNAVDQALDHARRFLAENPAAIVTSHYQVDAWDPMEALTFSRRILTGIVREDLNYNGLIISGPMDWRSANLKYTPGTGALIAVEAGCDMILQLSSDVQQMEERIEGVLAAVRSGRLPEARLNASVRRILAAKERLGLLENPYPKAEAAGGTAADSLRRANETGARNGVVVLADNGNLLPLPREGKRILCVNPFSTTEYVGAAMEEVHLGRTLGYHVKAYAPEAEEIRIGLKPSRAQRERILRQGAEADLIVVGVLFSQASPELKGLVEEILGLGREVVLVGLGLPSDLAPFKQAGALLAAHGPASLSSQAAAAVLFGEAMAGGRLPMPVGESYPMGHRVSQP